MEVINKIIPGRRNYDNCDLRNCNLAELDLRGLSFARSNLSRVNLSYSYMLYTNCVETDFSYANLTNTNFSAAMLEGADLSHTLMEGTKFTCANLYRARVYNTPLSADFVQYSFPQGPSNLDHSLSKDYILKNQSQSQNILKTLKEKFTMQNSKMTVIATDITKRTAIEECAKFGQETILQLFSLLGVDKTSKIYEFFNSNFASGVIKAATGFFLLYCPFTQEQRFQVAANELLTQAGVTSLRSAIAKLLDLVLPQANKFIGMVEKLTMAQETLGAA